MFLLLMAQVAQQPLELTCLGAGTANKPSVTTINSPVSNVLATVRGSRQQDFADQVDVRLFGGDDRIRLPRTMLPTFRGGRDGWFKLKGVRADSRSIRASAAVNLLNNPQVFIDRTTGIISINGKAGTYTGQCQAVDRNLPSQF